MKSIKRSYSLFPLSQILLSVILISIFNCTKAQERIQKVVNWRSYEIPKTPNAAVVFNNSSMQWKVFLKHRNVWVENIYNRYTDSLPFKFIKPDQRADQYEGTQKFISVYDGYLVAFDRGEWGCSLFWFSKNGADHYQIPSHRILQFLKRKDKIYAVSGHGSTFPGEGPIYEVKKIDRKWVPVKVVQLPTAPQAISFDNHGNFICVSSHDIMRIDKNFKIEVLYKDAFFRYYLYPNSIVQNKDIIYIGLMGGAATLNLKNNKLSWLLPADYKKYLKPDSTFSSE